MAYRRADHVAWRALGEETVVVDLRSNWMYGLNETGGRVWEALEESVEPETLAASLGLSGSELERALMAIEDFLAELCSADLVEAIGTSQPTSRESARVGEASVTFVPPAILFSEEIRNFGQSFSEKCFGDSGCDQGSCGG